MSESERSSCLSSATLADFLDHLRRQPFYQGQMVHIEHLPARGASHAALNHDLHRALEEILRKRGLFPLYTHQAQAIDHVLDGKNVVVGTPTASGKSLCYHVPVLEAILADSHARALYLFPTKALAQDQRRSLEELAAGIPRLKCNTFDGDTPPEQRGGIRRSAQIILTNPDMLHLGIMPNHPSWSHFLGHLRYVVIDEAHVYRGVFGSHVANVVRRLRRLCKTYGSQPQFICCSATIANPREHVARLVGLPFALVDDDGAPKGAKDFVFWNPPILDEAKVTRRSANSEATYLFTELVKYGLRTLTFVKSRRLAELIYLYTKEALAEQSPELVARISPYRAGYLPEERRRIERALFAGQLWGVTCTTALELGVDIGHLAATVLTGYPGTIASTWQQAGRSGRGLGPSLSFLIGLDNPLDQYLMRHPQAFFGRSPESALINPANPHVLGFHLLCAAYEAPLTEGDAGLFGEAFEPTVQTLVQQDALHRRGHRWHLRPRITYPAQEVNIRSSSKENYIVVDASQGHQVLETVDSAAAFFQIYPGAIYLHQGESYLITQLDLGSRTATATPTDAPYYTQTKELNDLRILNTWEDKEIGPVRAYLGEVRVSTTVVGFKKLRQFTEEVLGEEFLDLPPVVIDTVALWFDILEGAEVWIKAQKLDFPGGLHATEHAAIGMLPFFAMCDRNDIGGLSTPRHVDTGRAQIFIYDAQPGGVGIAEKGYAVLRELWQTTLEAISACPCEGGCPSCVQSPKCGNNNQPLDKEAARVLLEGLLS